MRYSIGQEEVTLVFPAKFQDLHMLLSVLLWSLVLITFIEVPNLLALPLEFTCSFLMLLFLAVASTRAALLNDEIQLKVHLKTREVLILSKSAIKEQFKAIPFEKISEINWGFIHQYTVELFFLLTNGEKLIIYSESFSPRQPISIDCSKLPEIINKLNASIQQCKETLSTSCSSEDGEQSTQEKRYLRLDKNTLY